MVIVLISRPANIGLLHPGVLGEVIGKQFQKNGCPVFTATAGRSQDTVDRADKSDFIDLGTIEEMVSEVDVIVSIVGGAGVFAVYGLDTPNEIVNYPVAEAVIHAGFKGVYVDANSIISDPEQSRWEHSLADYVNSSGASYISASVYGYPNQDGRIMFVSGDRAEAIVSLLPKDDRNFLYAKVSPCDAKEHKRQLIIDNVPPDPESYSRTDESWIDANK